ncbi:MAG: phosphoribosylformylglycinamidine cyclo-ligase [Desulfarculaceae bacterium]|nr:phosphoribosylformylglycinamidine cyclo-ligase [Desulfarculaceae bacterium]MCF8072351.1 phosphoribosylformylglycinamidine cyclo-ligase [Desulfarculaceae bacterium]MCF8100272.1 phosphoribosylformylglycinamidine cyclo-ligase [Desulfarculaceae bacterium]MCF8116155.1 phosphoribosylformylglycinamidine cyclo-ligase [Desulfarculaceae bacterium]
MSQDDRYRAAGVDIEKADQFIKNIGDLVKSTHTKGVVGGLGGFSGLFSLAGMTSAEPVLVSSTDGVGTKLKIAFLTNQHDTIGIDMVAMVVNDIVVTGAKPLFLLDYLATGKLELGVAEAVIAGVVDGCRQADCALIGGETAEMPGMYPPGEYDLAGFAVGLADRAAIIDGSRVAPGAAVVGLASSGLHSNGFSLVRKIVFEELGLAVGDRPAGLEATVGETLLTPTKIYVKPVLAIKNEFDLLAAAHITGGGLLENLPRVLPPGCRAVIEQGSWPVPQVFSWLQEAGKLSQREMSRTFNWGLGMALVVPGAQAGAVISRLTELGEEAFMVGEITARQGDEPLVEVKA